MSEALAFYRQQEGVVCAAPDNNCATMQDGAKAINYQKEAVRKEQYMTTGIGVCHQSCVPRKERNIDKGKSREVGNESQLSDTRTDVAQG